MELSEIGNRIRSERRRKGLTQARLAEMAGLSRATLNGLEKGTVRELGFHKLDAVLGILGLELAPTRARKRTGPSTILMKRMAQRYIWWRPPEAPVEDPRRVIAQVMDVGTYEDIQELARAGAVASVLSRVGAVLDSGDPGSIAAVRSGRAAVQDEGSQLVALAVAGAKVSTGSAHEKWLDLCAGPGGKAALLATLGAKQGATLFANEISEHRTELVRQTLDAALDSGIEIMIGTSDGREIGEDEPGTFDRVLVDAPCTGLGALRRRPEARWRRTPADLVELSSLQRALLVSAIEATKPGGVIGYATCSPHLAETRFVVSDVAKKRQDVEIVDARDLFRGADGRPVENLGEGPFVQLWPHVHGTDAMFFSLLRKRA